MTKIKHTPTPWEVEDPMGADIGLWIVEAGKQAYEWRCIALVCQDGDREPGDPKPIRPLEQEANAAFIVKAVNCHDALLEALKAVMKELMVPGRVSNATSMRAFEAIGKASPTDGAALATSQGQAVENLTAASPSPKEER